MWRKERVIIMAIPAYYSLLQRGSSGPDVALVQTWLNGVRDACTWYSELKADGKFGISTENAVKEFQLKNKMNVDGKVGANTWNVLYTRYTATHGLHVPYPGIALRSGSSGGIGAKGRKSELQRSHASSPSFQISSMSCWQNAACSAVSG